MAAPVTAHNSAIPFDPTKLADIQLPEAISFWPPAPGWWLLLIVIIFTLMAIIYLLTRKPRKPVATGKQLKSQALQELQTIKKTYAAQSADNLTAHNTLKQLSILLRRYALSLYQRDDVASLTDSQWLELLDKMADQPVFSSRFAALLTQLPYQSTDTMIDHSLLSELFIAAEKLIVQTCSEFNAREQEKQHV